MTIERIIGEFGYIGIFLLTFVEAEGAILVGGVLAKQHLLSLYGVILSGFFSGIISDIAYFYFARRTGPTVLARFDVEKKAKSITHYFERYRIPLLLTYRFIYGFRMVINFLFGLSGVSSSTYIILSIIGGIFWSTTVAFLGYSFGVVILSYMPRAREVVGIFFLIIILFTIRFWIKIAKSGD